jgi:Tol biopolymer transport system component
VSCGGNDKPVDQDGHSFLLAREYELIRRDGAKERTLLSFPQGNIVRAPALSPDGTKLAFVLQPPAGRDTEGRLEFGSDLYVAGADGSSPRLLRKHGSNGEFVDSPAWLNGTTLLFAVRGLDAGGKPDYRAESLDLTSMQTRRVFGGAAELTLAPDARRVVFVRPGLDGMGDTLELTTIDGGPSRTLAGVDAGLTSIASPAVSPDGRVVAFVAAGGSAGAPRRTRGASAATHPFLHDVWVVGIDGSDLHRLADIAQPQASLTWSADGTSLYVLCEEATWQIDANSGERRKIGAGIAWGQIRLFRN